MNPQSLDKLSVRTQNCLAQVFGRYRYTKEDVRLALSYGLITWIKTAKTYHIKDFGLKSYKEVCTWAGYVDPVTYPKPCICKLCGQEINTILDTNREG